MTIEEKLQHFYDVSIQSADGQASQELKAHQKYLEETAAKHREARRQDMEDQIRAESENAKREINKAISAEQLSQKRRWTTRQDELKDKLFVEVKNKLERFMDTRKYEDFLCRKIKDAVDFAGRDEIFVYLTPEDSSYQSAVVARTGVPVRISREPFIGGIRATIPSKNILIDNSFQESIQTLRKEFTFDGGMIHE